MPLAPSVARSLLAAALLVGAAAPLRAQRVLPADGVVAPGAAADTSRDALAGLRAAALRPGTWTYASTVTRDGASIELARRTLTIAPVSEDGSAAWLLLDVTAARGQTMTDSLVVARDDLRPLRRAAEIGPVRLTLRFVGDSAVGTMRVPGEEALPVAAASPGATLVASGGMLEAALRLLPLGAGWSGRISQLAPGPLGVSAVPVTLAVTGDTAVTVPAGRFDAWVVTATSAGATQTLWVAKEGGVLVRQQASPPHAAEVSYETVLVEATPATP
jgi:hypothetical protein